jgi:hypothetical protein
MMLPGQKLALRAVLDSVRQGLKIGPPDGLSFRNADFATLPDRAVPKSIPEGQSPVRKHYVAT